MKNNREIYAVKKEAIFERERYSKTASIDLQHDTA
jgi:hypothetical protein